MNHITANKEGCLAGYYPNFRDSITLTNVKVTGGYVCRAFNGRKDGKEPTAVEYRAILVLLAHVLGINTINQEIIF